MVRMAIKSRRKTPEKLLFFNLCFTKTKIKGFKPNLPIVALTADVITQPEYLREQGLDDVLTKPIDSSELVRVLNHYLGHPDQ